MVTMIVASFLHKLSQYYSLGRWLASADMRRVIPPRDAMLKPHISVPAANGRSKRKGTSSRAGADDSKPLDTSLTLPKSANLALTTTPVMPHDLQLIHYYPEFRWLVDVGLAALTVYVATCVYHCIKPSAAATEYNLSVVWLGFLLIFSTALLGSLTMVYFSEELSRERSVIVVFTTLFFVFALVVLLVDENILQFRLVESHNNITHCIGKLLHAYISDPDNFVLLPLWAFKVGLAFVSSLLSAVLIFPSFRYSEMHFNAVLTSKNLAYKTVVKLCYLMPLFCLGLWIKPFSKDVFSELDIVHMLGKDIYYETFRYWSLLVCCGLRIGLFKLHLQNYLDLARLRVEDLRKEQGRISVIDLRKKVSNIFAFYAGVGLQYVAPVLILFSLAVLVHISSPHYAQSEAEEDVAQSHRNVFRSSGFGIVLFHGCLSFLCWWVCFTVFVASGFGSALRTYL